MFYDTLANPTLSIENIKKEMNNVNSEISMRMTYNKNLAYYKIIKAIGNKKCKIFSDGFDNINVGKVQVEDL